MKDSVPCQAVSNKLEVFNLPEEFQIICKLKVLIGKCILFKKVAIMRRREMKNMTGTICNIPVDNIDVTNLSPRTSHSSRLMNVKFKHKLEYHGYVLFEPVRPDSPWSVLSYLKQNNQFYKDALPWSDCEEVAPRVDCETTGVERQFDYINEKPLQFCH